jgi:hypothetical protein
MNRFWAWNSYIPFSLAVSLIFFGQCDGAIVLSILLLSTIPLHLYLNQLEASHLLPADRPSSLPQSKLLQVLVGMCFTGIAYQLLHTIRPNTTLDHKVRNFLSDMATPWIFGSFASQIPLINFGSVLAGVIYINCTTPVKPGYELLAKLALILLFVLSLFTVFVTSSELNSLGDTAGFVTESFLKKLIGLPIDLVISVCWLVVLFKAFSALRREQLQYFPLAMFDPPFPSLRTKLASQIGGWASLAAAFLILRYRA